MKTFFLLLACVILLISVAGFTACAEPTSTPTSTPTSEPTSTPTPGKWKADGVIEPNEYQGSNIYGDYEIYWSSDEQYVYIAMKARSNGWVSMAIQPGSEMKDADMVIGFFDNGEATLYDCFCTDASGAHSPDTQLGGTDNIIEFGGDEEAGYTMLDVTFSGFTTLEFKRALNTGDDCDIPLTSGVNKIIWAYCESDSLETKYFEQGSGEINL